MKAKEITHDYFVQHVCDYINNGSEWKFLGERPAILDFYATWCGPCKATAPHLDKIAEEYEGRLDVLKIDVDQEPKLAQLFGVRSVPTLLFIPMAEQPQMQTGAMSYAQLKEVADSFLLK